MENKTCENCIYFCQHYVFNGVRFSKTIFGHCKNCSPNKHSICKRITESCAGWECGEAKKAEILQRIDSEALRKAKQLLETANYIQTLK